MVTITCLRQSLSRGSKYSDLTWKLNWSLWRGYQNQRFHCIVHNLYKNSYLSSSKFQEIDNNNKSQKYVIYIHRQNISQTTLNYHHVDFQCKKYFVNKCQLVFVTKVEGSHVKHHQTIKLHELLGGTLTITCIPQPVFFPPLITLILKVVNC